MTGPVPPAGPPAVQRPDRIRSVIPYMPLPFRDESRSSGGGYGARKPTPVRAAAEAAAAWAAASRKALELFRQLQDYRTSAWQQRVVATGNEAVRGTAARGAAVRTYAVQVDRLAARQINRGFELAEHAGSVIEAGLHTLVFALDGRTAELTVAIGSSDTNGKALAGIRVALEEADIGIAAALARDKAAGTVSLVLASVAAGRAAAFRVVDAPGGSAAAAAGIASVLEPASDAEYRVDGLAPAQSPRNEVALDAGKVKLVFGAVTDSPVSVRVTVDADAVVVQTADAVDAVNGLARLAHAEAGHLNPALLPRLERAMDAGLGAFGLSRTASGEWRLDAAEFRERIVAEPEAVRRRLIGPGGWAAAVERELERFGAVPMEALLHPASPVMTASATYQADASLRRQPPPTGWLYTGMS